MYWETAVVAVVVAILLVGAICGWSRRNRRASIIFVAAGLVLAETINLGAIMITAYSAQSRFRRVHSLQALVGDAPVLQVPAKSATSPAQDTFVVLGDSTAAGLDNRPLLHPTKADKACGRSRDTYAADLAAATAVPVTNLACSGATIPDGLLGPRHVSGQDIPAQLTERAVLAASTVIVSVGANDVRWSDLLRICAVSTSCNNNAEEAVFQQYLARFSTDYLRLLSALQLLPNHPRVLINLYFDPFGDNVGCLTGLGVTPQKQAAMLSRLAALNHILTEGAKAAAMKTAAPNFAKHGLCSDVPYVQGVHSTAPFHPTPAGELAIALADEHALHSGG